MTQASLRRSFYAVTVLRWLPVGFVIPFIILIMQERGLALSTIGVIWAVYGVTVAVLELPTGSLADTLGRRPVLLTAGLLNLLAMAVFLFADSLPAFVTSMVMLGAARALDSGPLDAWYVDSAMAIDHDVDLRGALAGAGVASGSAIAIGAVAGGLVPKVLPTGWVLFGLEISELAIPLLASIAIAILHLASVWFLVTEDRHSRGATGLAVAVREAPQVMIRGARMATRQPVIRSLLLVMVVTGITISSVEVLWQPRLADLVADPEGSTEVFGLIAGLGFVAVAAGSGVAPRLAARFGGRGAVTAMAGQVAVGLSLLGMALATGVGLVAMGFVIFYLFLGVIGPLHQELLHAQVTSEERSTMLSADSLSMQLGGVVGTMVVAAFAAATSIRLAWVVVAVIAASAALLYLAVHRRIGGLEETAAGSVAGQTG